MNLKLRAVIAAVLFAALFGTILFVFHTGEMLQGPAALQILKVFASVMFALTFGTVIGLAVYAVEKFFDGQEDFPL